MDSQIAIARDFTKYPGPRYKESGPFSGELFRDEMLIPALRDAIRDGGRVVVNLDDVAGYGSSFLEESFGGLLRKGFRKEDLDRHLTVIANRPQFRHHALRAQQYIDEAASRMQATAH
jgi:hypothetical protein